MLSLIAFGVVALIVVVLLLTFNIRSMSRGHVHPPKVEAARTSEPIKEMEPIKEIDPVKEIEPAISQPDTPPPSGRDSTSTFDREYRSSLRQFQTPAATNSPEPEVSRRSDAEYRAALRSMHKPGK